MKGTGGMSKRRKWCDFDGRGVDILDNNDMFLISPQNQAY